MKRFAPVLLLLLLAAPAQAVEPDYHWRGPTGLTMSQDGRFVYATGTFRTLTFRREGDGRLAITDDRGPAGQALALSPDGRHAYIATRDGRILILNRNAATGDIVFDTSLGTGLRHLRALTIAPDGRHLYAASEMDDAIAIVERDTAGGGLRTVNVVFGG